MRGTRERCSGCPLCLTLCLCRWSLARMCSCSTQASLGTGEEFLGVLNFTSMCLSSTHGPQGTGEQRKRAVLGARNAYIFSACKLHCACKLSPCEHHSLTFLKRVTKAAQCSLIRGLHGFVHHHHRTPVPYRKCVLHSTHGY